jgi:hypothetical protein
MKKLLLLPAFLLTFIYSCKKVDSNDLKDEVPYYQSYSAAYDKVDNSLKTTAEFRIRESNGAKVELTNGASVKINGNTPGTALFDKAQYTWNTTGTTDVTFVLTKNSGQTFTNTIKKTELEDLDFPSTFPSSISKSSGITFIMDGPAMLSGQNLTMTVSGKNVNDSTNASITRILNSMQVQLNNDDLKSFKSGTIHMSFTKAKRNTLDAADGTAGGTKEVTIYNYRDLSLTN